MFQSELALFNFESTQYLNNLFGDNDAEVTPVPIPNTVVKLCSADDTWREAARESRSSPELKESTYECRYSFAFVEKLNEYQSLFGMVTPFPFLHGKSLKNPFPSTICTC